MKRKLLWTLVTALLGLVAACGNKDSNNVYFPPVIQQGAAPVLLATGGSSTSGTGGTGGYVYLETYGGSAKVLKYGTVDVVITVPTYTPDFGTGHAIVSAGTTTTVAVDADDFGGELCMTSGGSPYLYIGDGHGTCGDAGDTFVTGLTVEAGATLVLADYGYWGGYGELWLDNDLVINGTITTDASNNGLYIEANTIDVEASGKIVTSATTSDSNAGELYLGYDIDMTYQIINKGSIEAKGLGGGIDGYVYLDAHDLVVNTGTIDASGGDGTIDGSAVGYGGDSGELTVYSDYGDFYSSGIVRVNAGRGTSDGGYSEYDICNYDCNATIWLEANYYGEPTKNGDIYIGGTWEAKGGDGAAGYGGSGGYIYLQTNTLGTVTINADMSVKGGDGSGTGNWGEYTYGIDIFQRFNPNNDTGFVLPAAAGKISLAGKYDLRGGSGDGGGGYAGYLEVYGNNAQADVPGADIELAGFAAMDLNGGEGASGGSANGDAFEIYTYNTSGSTLAGAITNEANIQAKGGKATDAVNSGGSGGYVEMMTYGTGDPTAAVNVTNSGAITANGGAGTAQGGSGGTISLYSSDYATTPTANTGSLSAAGGTGSLAGADGTVTIDGTPVI